MNIEILTLNQPNITDFSKERNALLAKARKQWLLFLDTDEKISSELRNEIEKLDPKDANGFYIKRKIIFLGKEVGEDKVLRLGKVGTGTWHRKVHETWNIRGKIGTLKNYIIHETATDLSSYIAKMNYYTDIHAKENLREGKRFNYSKLIFYPKMKFLQNIFAGRGFLFSMLQSYHSFLGWIKLWELQKK